MTKASVIIPCFNQGEFLEESVTSVLHQTLEDLEILIINDGSTDDTEEKAKHLQTLDSRIKYYKQTNQGLAAARNNGIKHAEGKYILPLDADDKISANYIQEAIQILENKQSVKIVYADAEKFGEETGPWELPEFDIQSFLQTNCIYCSAVFRKSDFYKTNGYNTNMKYGWEDWDLWISLLETGGDVHKIPKVHFFYRIRKESMVRKLTKEQSQILYKEIFFKHYDFYAQVFGNPVQTYMELKSLKEKIDRIQSSWSYRIGKAITSPARFFRKKIM